MRRTFTTALTAALTVVTTLALASTLAPAQAAQPDPERRAVAVRITASNDAFSPNGDGSKDRGIVKYRLGGRAQVTVKVTRAGKDVLVRRLGTQRTGTHAFTWNGKRAGGKTVRDGRYRVTVIASSGEARRYDRAALVVKARYDVGGGELLLSSGTVYPRTTDIDDVVAAGFDATGSSTGSVFGVRLQVLDRSGRLVDSAPLVGGPRPARATWDGRDRLGQIVPAGAYRLRLVRGADTAGNPRLLAPGRTVRVSDRKLVAKTRTVSVAAADAQRVHLDDAGCNGCNEAYCTPVPSDRFPEGLSFRSVESPPRETIACQGQQSFTLSLDVRRTTYDSYRVIATGGPRTPGGADAGVLSVGQYGQGVMSGDATVSVSSGFTPGSDVPEQADPGLYWTFTADRASAYDLAAFDVQYTTYVPAS